MIESYNPPDIGTRYHWVSLYGENNRVDHNRFTDQTHSGVTVVAWLDGSETNHRIDANHFDARPEGNANGFEAIRIGTSTTASTVARVTVENNVFDRQDGEIEIISNKSTGNTIQYNTFRDSAGTLTLRHGNDATVAGNFFLGENRDRSGGIRVYGEDHAIVNNYLADIDDRADGAISLETGEANTPANGFQQVKNVLIAHNTIVNAGGAGVKLDHSAGGDRDLLPEDVTFAANLISNPDGEVFEGAAGPGLTFSDNLVFGAPLGVSAQPGITVADPRLELAGDGLYRPAADSPAIDAVSQGGLVTVDVDGQARIGLADIGADERSSAQIVRRPLVGADVGPTGFGDPGDPAIPAGAFVVREAEDFSAITDPDGDGEVWRVAAVSAASRWRGAAGTRGRPD